MKSTLHNLHQVEVKHAKIVMKGLFNEALGNEKYTMIIMLKETKSH